jgi:antitoxin ParD1/3/4
MPTRNIVLTDHQAALVERLVSSGRYQNASEVLRQGLRLLEREEADLAALLAKVDEAEAAYAAGDFVTLRNGEDIRAFFDEIEREIDEAGIGLDS